MGKSVKKWYKEGLHFRCTECGKCCTGFPGYVFISKEEREKIAKLLKLRLEDFEKKYCRYSKGKWSLIEKVNFDCIFLKDKKCMVYPVRPTQCNTYPYWPSVLESESSWIEEAERCEGIREEEKKVDYATIEKNLMASLKN